MPSLHLEARWQFSLSTVCMSWLCEWLCKLGSQPSAGSFTWYGKCHAIAFYCVHVRGSLGQVQDNSLSFSLFHYIVLVAEILYLNLWWPLIVHIVLLFDCNVYFFVCKYSFTVTVLNACVYFTIFVKFLYSIGKIKR